MSFMFNVASSFNQDLSSWNVERVTEMNYMFQNASSFESDLSSWCVSAVSSEPTEFSSGTADVIQPVWGTCPLDPAFRFSGVTGGNVILKGFPVGSEIVVSGGATVVVTDNTETYQASAASGISKVYIDPLGEWGPDVSVGGKISSVYEWGFDNNPPPSFRFEGLTVSLTRLPRIAPPILSYSRMFQGSILSITLTNLQHWDTSNVTDMSFMFANMSTTTNWSAIAAWDVESVTNFESMFEDLPSSVNPDISAWNPTSAIDMTNMFKNAVSFNQDLSGWNVPLIEESPEGFDEGATNWLLPRPNFGT